MLEAAGELLLDGGLAATTIEAVAARAKVSKVTIYKWWPSRGALAIDAYFHRYRETIVFEESGDVATDLLGQLEALIIAFRGPAGRLMAELIGQSQTDAALAEQLRERWVAPRREVSSGVLRRAIERGQVRPDIDIETVMDQLYAPIYYRLAMGHQPLDAGLSRRLVDGILVGVGVGGNGRGPGADQTPS